MESVALRLAAGETIVKAAPNSGCGVQTVKDWLGKRPEFKRRIGELRREMTERGLGRLVDSMASAAETLAYLSRKGKSEMVRVISARALSTI